MSSAAPQSPSAINAFSSNKTAVGELFQAALHTAFPALVNAEPPFAIEVEKPKNPEHGHFAVNSALQLAKRLGKKPREIAEAIVAALPKSALIAGTPDIAGPGFINIRLSQEAETRVVKAIESGAEKFGTSNVGAGQKTLVEFVSANPTGPLHVGHGRAAAIGDTLSRLLASQGYAVSREFYYNDAGAQINNLALSVQFRCRELGGLNATFPEDGYRGEYIIDIARRYREENPADANADNLDQVRQFAVAALRHEQDLDLKAFDVSFDNYFLESSLYKDGLVEKTVAALSQSGHTFEDGGALWLRTTTFGDDKDRVMRKSDGSYTYFVPDIAYHLTKWERGYRRAINEQGADHHSTITRVRAGLQALQVGIPPGWPEYVLHQMVTVMRQGEEVKLSKRAGSYVTLRDLVDEVGCDAARYFLVARKADSQLVFDIDLARSQSNDNPVYYIQYAHARVCSVLRQLIERGLSWDRDNGFNELSRLNTEHEQALMLELSRYPELIEMAAQNLEPHLLAQYLRDLAYALHTWYNAHQFIVADVNLRDARLALALATRQVLANGLGLLGVSAPESM